MLLKAQGGSVDEFCVKLKGVGYGFVLRRSLPPFEALLQLECRLQQDQRCYPKRGFNSLPSLLEPRQPSTLQQIDHAACLENRNLSPERELRQILFPSLQS